MSRSVSALLMALTLVTGMLLGVLLDRRGGVVSAQERELSPVLKTEIPPLPRAAGEEAVYQQLTRQYSQFEPINRTFEAVAQAVSPAVVHIEAEIRGKSDESPRKHTKETGSGVLVRGDRGKGVYVLTNHHVVEGSQASKIHVFLQDGRSLRPQQIWLDPMADIAVLDLNRDDLFAARFGNSEDMAVGTWVLALGSPFGLTHSVSQGIISARGRHMDELVDVKNQDFLQTDAAINPGNSGGPLVNMKGEVIGINNSIASNHGGNEGVGFSIPSNLARWIMNELIKNGRVTRGALGIDLHPDLTAEDAVRLGLERPRGAWVGQVYPTSPASEAGLHDGDVILRFQDTEINNLSHLINVVSMAPIGKPASLVVWRDKQRISLRVTVGDRDRTTTLPLDPVELARERATSRGNLLKRPARPEANSSIVMGIHLQTLEETTARRLELPATLKGAVVVRVEPNSPLASLLQPLDIVHSVNGRAVANAEEAVKAISSRFGADDFQVGYDRVVKGAIERRTAKLP